MTELVPVGEASPFAYHGSIEAGFRARIERFLDEVRRRGYDELELAPPVCRLMWRHGVALPPPVFLGLAQQVFLGAVCTGILFGTGMTLFLGAAAIAVGGLGGLMLLPLLFCFSAASFGTLFGTFYVLRTRYLAWRLALPDWEEYGALDGGTNAAPRLEKAWGCPRCGNEPLACHTHRLVWCEKCVHDLQAMGEESWRALAHEQDASCAVALAEAAPGGYRHTLPLPDGNA